MRTVDRLAVAGRLASNRRVLDIGGRGMPPCNDPSVKNISPCVKASDPANSLFARAYRRIGQAASEYRVLDVRNEPDVSYCLNLNQPGCIERLHAILDEYKPEVILCMETLEHLNYHFEVMNEMAYSIETYGSSVFITLPNNGNWILNFLGWNHDHCVAFFGDIADRFVKRSNLGKFRITSMPCFQKYLWYWWLPYALSGCQPFSWGFLVQPNDIPHQ